jgi:hypothetical protein
MSDAVIVALIASIPTVLLSLKAWRDRQVNPMTNGTDWIASQWERLLEAQIAENERLHERLKERDQ